MNATILDLDQKEDCLSRNCIKVLCVDDDPAVGAAISRRFHMADVEVIQAFDGAQGIWLAKYENPDVIITDFSMPGFSGLELVKCLKQSLETMEIPIFILTGNHDRRLAARLKEIGVARVFEKPTDTSEILLACLAAS